MRKKCTCFGSEVKKRKLVIGDADDIRIGKKGSSLDFKTLKSNDRQGKMWAIFKCHDRRFLQKSEMIFPWKIKWTSCENFEPPFIVFSAESVVETVDDESQLMQFVCRLREGKVIVDW